MNIYLSFFEAHYEAIKKQKLTIGSFCLLRNNNIYLKIKLLILNFITYKSEAIIVKMKLLCLKTYLSNLWESAF